MDGQNDDSSYADSQAGGSNSWSWFNASRNSENGDITLQSVCEAFPKEYTRITPLRENFKQSESKFHMALQSSVKNGMAKGMCKSTNKGKFPIYNGTIVPNAECKDCITATQALLNGQEFSWTASVSTAPQAKQLPRRDAPDNVDNFKRSIKILQQENLNLKLELAEMKKQLNLMTGVVVADDATTQA